MKTSLTLCCLLVSQLVFAAAKTWTGNTSTDWATATNWSGNSLPASGDDITIPTSPAGGRMPTISADYTIYSLTIQTGATLTHTGGILSVIGGFTSITGTYTKSGGTFLSDKNITVNSGGQLSHSGGTMHMASSTGIDPTDHIIISANGNIILSAGTIALKDLTINTGSPNGTFSQSGGILEVFHDFKGGGTFSASGGTIQFTGDGGGATFPSTISSSNTQFHHVIIDAAVDPGFDENGSISFNVSGDWTNNSSVAGLIATGTTVIFNGTGAQAITGSQTTTFRNLTIDKASGTASLGRNTTVNNGNLTVSSGTLDLLTYTLNRSSAGGTFSVANGATVRFGNNTGGQTGSNFPLNFSSVSLGSTSTIRYNGDETITQTIYAAATYGHLSLTNGSGSGTAAKITTANITVNGDLTVGGQAMLTPGAANTVGGTGTLTGSGIVKVTRTTATADFNSQYTISNKTLSSLTIDYAATAAQTVNAHNYYNLTISGARTTASVTLASSGTIGISGTFTPSATFTSGNYVLTGSTVEFNGGTAQNIPAFTFNNLAISNSAKTATGIINVNGAFTLSSCVLTTTSSFYLNIANNGTTSGAGLTAYVNGPVRKTGDDAFTFPVGKAGTGYMPVGISAPSSTTDAFTAEYMRSSGTSLGGITAPGLYRVSNCDYWNLDRTTGSSTVNVTLSWNGYSNCNAATFVNDLSTLTVAHFNGTSWDSRGMNSTSGNASSGTVTRNGVSTFSPFAIGSTSDQMNPLQVNFTSVKATRVYTGINISWINLAEENTHHYEIERSADGGSFAVTGNLPATVNGGNRAAYEWTDPVPADQGMYYRIKAVDNNGQYYYSNVVKAGSAPAKPAISIYPNPVKDQKFSIGTSALPAGTYEMKVYDHTGQVILQSQFLQTGSVNNQPVVLPGNHKTGTYHLRVTGNGLSLAKPFILQ